MRKFSYKNKRGGMATLELLIALSVLVINLTSIILLMRGGQSIALDHETNTEALTKAETLLASSQALAKKDFNLVNPLPASTNSIYTSELAVSQIDFFTKLVTSKITWNTDNSRPQKIELKTTLTNPDAFHGGDTCSSVLAGDWSSPTKTEYEFGRDILNDTSSGFPITSIATFKHKMYVTVNNDNGNNDEVFFILDITDPSIKPTVLGKLDNDADIGQGLNALALDGTKYVYVANNYGADFDSCSEDTDCSQLQVIDVSDSANPSLVEVFKVPDVEGDGGQSVGKSIFYKNGIIYLGLAKAIGPEFHIIDVGGGGTPSASPTHPVLLDSYEIGSAVNAIHVRDNYAYVASPDNQELKIFDVSNPSNITLVGGFDAPGGGANNGNGKSIYLVGDKLYFGRTLLNGNELYVLDNTNPASNLPVLGSKNIQNGSNNTSVNGMIIRDYLGFLITNSEFQIYNITNPANIAVHATPLTLPPGTGGGLQGTASDCEGNYIFVGSKSSNDKGYISVITGS